MLTITTFQIKMNPFKPESSLQTYIEIQTNTKIQDITIPHILNYLTNHIIEEEMFDPDNSNVLILTDQLTNVLGTKVLLKEHLLTKVKPHINPDIMRLTQITRVNGIYIDRKTTLLDVSIELLQLIHLMNQSLCYDTIKQLKRAF